MRALALILALAVISGCHGRSVSSLVSKNPKNPWEMTVEAFKNYFDDIDSKAKMMLKDIKSSELSRELSTLIQDSMSELAMYRDDLQTKLAPYTQAAGERMSEDLKQLYLKVQDHMNNAKNQMANYGQELQSMVEQNTEDFNARVSTYTRKLKKRLNKDMQEIKKNIDDYFVDFQSSTSENMEKVKLRFQPYFGQLRDNAGAKIGSLGELLKSQMEKAKDKLETTAENIKEQLDKTGEAIQSTMENRMENVRDWFQSVAHKMKL
ncbi:apolipoprotein Ea [Thalassophryne amazonica]|uniref:apolipoprotein Ea n=1 Tax=Thalassophryne amazonica TaxID=390379 RepID=UPI001470F88C|nr:apolipoprotein Ea [Thalassophryne amazonica]